MACDGLSANGSFIRFKIDDIEALGERSGAPTLNRATLEANSKTEPNYNCYIYDRIDVTWAFDVKVKNTAEDALYSAVEDHLIDGTPGTVEWGPFNNTIYVMPVLFTSISPTAGQGELVGATIAATGVGPISRTRLS